MDREEYENIQNQLIDELLANPYFIEEVANSIELSFKTSGIEIDGEDNIESILQKVFYNESINLSEISILEEILKNWQLVYLESDKLIPDNLEGYDVLQRIKELLKDYIEKNKNQISSSEVESSVEQTKEATSKILTLSELGKIDNKSSKEKGLTDEEKTTKKFNFNLEQEVLFWPLLEGKDDDKFGGLSKSRIIKIVDKEKEISSIITAINELGPDFYGAVDFSEINEINENLEKQKESLQEYLKAKDNTLYLYGISKTFTKINENLEKKYKKLKEIEKKFKIIEFSEEKKKKKKEKIKESYEKHDLLMSRYEKLRKRLGTEASTDKKINEIRQDLMKNGLALKNQVENPGNTELDILKTTSSLEKIEKEIFALEEKLDREKRIDERSNIEKQYNFDKAIKYKNQNNFYHGLKEYLEDLKEKGILTDDDYEKQQAEMKEILKNLAELPEKENGFESYKLLKKNMQKKNDEFHKIRERYNSLSLWGKAKAKTKNMFSRFFGRKK